MEDSRNIIKAIDALTLKAGGEAVDSKNITEAIDRLRAVYDESAIGIDKTLTQEGVAADAKAVGDFALLAKNITVPNGTDLNTISKMGIYSLYGQYTYSNMPNDINYGILVNITYSEESSIRIHIIINATAMYFRYKAGTRWYLWNKVDSISEV